MFFLSIRRPSPWKGYWYLDLSHAACVDGTPGADDPDVESVGDVRSIQLVLDAIGHSRWAPPVGESVRATGTLSHAISGHHHASVLMNVRSLEASR